LIELALYVLRNLFSRSREPAAPSVYLAYSIGPDFLAIAVQELSAQEDEDALQQATPLFNDGLKRVEVWCGSRMVGQFSPKSDEKSDGEPVRHSA
jgi:hypothetical protein